MEYSNKLLALSIWFFQVCLAFKLKELSLEILSEKVPPHLQGFQQARIIQPKSMNPVSIPELMKVSTVKTHGLTTSKLPKKFNEVKLQFIGIKLKQPKILPLEILASVRKNKKLLEQQRIQQTTHRHKTFITHTVVLKVANKQNKFHRGNNHKRLSQNWRRNRVRREVQDAFNSRSEQGTEKQPPTSDLVDNTNLIILKGNLLLLHLENLLKEANFYLPNEGEVIKWNTNYSMNTIRNSNTAPKNLVPHKFPDNKQNATHFLFDAKFVLPKTQEKHKRKRDWYILKHTCNKQPDLKATHQLLYEDVIANIRNMQNIHIFQNSNKQNT